MMPTRRKILLYGGLTLMGIVYAGDAALSKFVNEPFEAAGRKQAALQKRFNRRQLELKKANKSFEVLSQLEERSLPGNPELARSRYQAWLLDLIEQSALKSPNVDSGEARNHKGLYQTFTFSVRGRGTLAQVAQFLHAFYSAGHLHKIRSMTLNPMQSSDQINLSLSIEALSLKGASRTDELTTVSSQSLASSSLSDYQSFVRRNLFRAGDTNLAARSTVLTAITSDVRGRREAWFAVGKSGKTHVLVEGDSLAIDTLAARVIEIGADYVIVELDGARRALTVGKNLAEAAVLPAEA